MFQFFDFQANHFSSDLVALDGFAKKFEKNWKEELEHAEGLIKYVIKRGGVVSTPAISAPINDTNWQTMNVCQIVNTVLGLEMKVHESLLAVHKCASGEGVGGEDPHVNLNSKQFC